jgi:ABC-type transport system substrate-binding protein
VVVQQKWCGCLLPFSYPFTHFEKEKIMRKLLIVVSFLMVASMLLSACGTPAKTAAPATAAPATAAPAPNPYVGSGKLDGNGIPSNFFADVHIRKAFSYSFDWNTFITDVYKGEAVQSLEIPLPGMPGYDTNAPHYTMDLTKAAAEFKASTLKSADGKSLWDTGFRMQMLYNQGNTTRQTMSEILAANLAQINPKFVVEILGLPWPAYLAAQRASQIPIMTAGWLEDIHDPNDWYQPYTTGTYGSRQNLPSDLKTQFTTLLNQGTAVTDPAARTAVYKQVNQLYYDQAIGVPIALQTLHNYQHNWVSGVIRNPIFPGYYFYPVSKNGSKDDTTFTYATIGDALTMDPAWAYDTSSAEIIQNVYETLIFYDGEQPAKFVPMLADSWDVSADSKTYTFHLHPGVKFANGDPMTASDVAYSFERGILQGGSSSPQWLMTEAFLGSSVNDIAEVIDPTGALDDDQANLAKADPAKLTAACQKVVGAFKADDNANTVTMTLAQPWGPFLPTIAQTWGAVIDQKWAMANKTWDGSCADWTKYYSVTDQTDPLTKVMNGTGPFVLDHWTAGQEIVLTANPTYWGGQANKQPILKRVVVQDIPEWSTRFAELQAGDADIVDVDVANRSQVDTMVGQMQVYDATTNTFGPLQQVCGYDSTKLAVAQFKVCPAGTNGTGAFTLFIGQPLLEMDVIIYNFNIH